MWRLPLLWSWSIGSLFLPSSPGLPNKMVSKPLYDPLGHLLS
ncbi:hypothetical protein A2U01_0094901, partial [Trifolium medium]|nr:hypothetical protein [Trifolium medium]